MEMRQWPRRLKTSKKQHTTGPAPKNPADQGESDLSRLPWWDRYPSSSSGTQPRPGDTDRTTGAPASSTANPPSPRQDRAAKRAAQRYLPAPQRHPNSTSKPPQGAPSADKGSLAPPTKRGRAPHRTTTATHPNTSPRPEEPLGTTRPQTRATPSPLRNRTPRTPTSAHRRHHRPTPTQGDPEPHLHRASPARPAPRVPPVSPPNLGPTSALAPAHTTTPITDAPARSPRHGPQSTSPHPQGTTLA